MTMTKTTLIPIFFACLLLLTALFVLHQFIPTLIWAGLIAISTWPLFQKWHRCFGKHVTLSTSLFITLIIILLLIPLIWLISLLTTEAKEIYSVLFTINQKGMATPNWLINIPLYGDQISNYWEEHFTKPNGIKFINHLLIPYLKILKPHIQTIGLVTIHHLIHVLFCFLSLFFFYLHGEKIAQFCNNLGNNMLHKHWLTYAHNLPTLIRATVNGTVLVGLGIGVIMCIIYSFTPLPLPVLLGLITGIFAMIPFLSIVIFGLIGIYLLANGFITTTIFVVSTGAILMFIADHLVKPLVIGNTTKLPFLLILLSVIGGVETLGLLGLFLGPVIITLSLTLLTALQKSVDSSN